MIAMLRRVDYLAVLLLSVFWLAVNVVLAAAIPKEEFVMTVFTTAAFLVFTALLVKRPGAMLLFSTLSGVMAAPTGLMQGLGVQLIIILPIAGATLELFSIAGRNVRNIPLHLMVGAGIAMATIPWTMKTFAVVPAALTLLVWNFSLLAFFLGVAGSVLAVMVWEKVRNTKNIIKYEYAV
jgi:hypothetical protein